ncbi:LysR family transcriptional regulator substrate-binding protein [Cnuibacter physcomitrellae]|uniref:LysR family transcriptional regulator substrate-binding protein n=1 Tax=Cnuibacter physcomitrellae TaxID=1619308 RepID=UPI0021760174|nr:LysR family transcriptional regulator substrate-binding protein [Cnuibacter physcomitrellae]MCS5498184.1 LysR family transcriptional regulator substrate-binding protein [Cnuibacter physcomitrellae]
MTFRVAFVPGVTPTKWVRIWRERMSEPIETAAVTVDDQRTVVLAGEADVCFARLPLDRDGLHAIPLWEEPAVVVAPREHVIEAGGEVALADLVDEDVRPVASGEEEGAIELVAHGGGLVIVPQPVARLYGRRDVVVRPVTDAEPTRIALVWPVDLTDEQRERVDAFVGIVRGRTSASSRGGEPAASSPERGSGKSPERGSARSGGRGSAKSGGSGAASASPRSSSASGGAKGLSGGSKGGRQARSSRGGPSRPRRGRR